MLTRGDVDLSSPVDWDHDDNTGLALLLLGLPGVGGSSRWPDLTGRGDGGAVQSGATWVGTSQNQSGLLLPGANDTTGCVTVADPDGRFAGVPTLTVALWTRADNNGANSFGRAITQNDNIGWSIQNNSGVGVQFAVGGTTASYSYPSLVGSGFHRWAMVYDGARIWGGFDGVVVTSLAKTGAIPASSLGVVVGNRTAGARGWGGVITGVRVQPGFAPADIAGWIARDYEWARDPSTDPRLRRLRYPVSLLTGGTAYSLTADTGVFAQAGLQTALRVGRRITGAPGGYSVAGVAAALKAGRRISAAPGAYALAGPAAGQKAGRKVTAGVGALSLAGQAAAVRAARRLRMDAGGFNLTGLPADLVSSGTTSGRVFKQTVKPRGSGSQAGRGRGTYNASGDSGIVGG